MFRTTHSRTHSPRKALPHSISSEIRGARFESSGARGRTSCRARPTCPSFQRNAITLTTLQTVTCKQDGLTQLKKTNPDNKVEAETMADESGIETDITFDIGGGMKVISLGFGDRIRVRGVDFRQYCRPEYWHAWLRQCHRRRNGGAAQRHDPYPAWNCLGTKHKRGLDHRGNIH